MKIYASILLGSLAFSGLANAQETGLTLPHQFEANTVISAEAMNEQFEALKAPVELNTSDINAHVERLDALEMQMAEMMSELSARDAAVEQLNDRLYEAETRLAAFQERIETREVIVVSAEPEEGEYARLDLALASLEERLILPGHQVTIRVQAGTYVHAAPVVIDHPQSAQIDIIGDVNAPDRVRLFFEESDGIVVASKTQAGTLSGMTLEGGWSDNNEIHTGVHCDFSSSVIIGDGMVIHDFGLGVSSKGDTLIGGRVDIVEGRSGISARVDGMVGTLPDADFRVVDNHAWSLRADGGTLFVTNTTARSVGVPVFGSSGGKLIVHNSTLEGSGSSAQGYGLLDLSGSELIGQFQIWVPYLADLAAGGNPREYFRYFDHTHTP